ncbi:MULTISPECIES: phage minor capsid protein [unclassified Clostridium]|uniref:phage minor capsid protein n=1 Tax=unclassified Clostridium TaxID=2614128 RepID=UPI001105D4B5|nr:MULTISPECIES: phage minor capsid protein [unclassified Clostridium]
MLTYRQLNDLPRSVVRIMTEAEQSIIDDMARRIARLGKVTASTEWQLKRLEALGVEEEVIIKRLRAALGKSEQQLIALFDEAATRTLEKDDGVYKAAGYDPIPLKDNPQMQQILRVGYAEASTLLANLTRTTASTATHQFERALDLAYTQIVTGGMDYQTAIKRAVRSLAQRGLSTVHYASGHADALDVAVRRAVMTGVSQTVGKLQMQRAQEMGQDLMELTAHAGARPTHAVWQGKLVSLSGRPGYLSLTDIGYGDPAGFKGVNCGHDWYPYFEGLSEPAYTPEQLRKYNDRTVKYDGKEMDLYDATQHQRYIERQIRRWKRESSALDAAGLDNSYARGKVSQWQATQRDFIRQTGLRRDYFRERAGKQNLERPTERDILRAAEQHIQRVSGIRGQVHLNPKAIDPESLGFDDAYINAERGHNVSSDEAKRFIRTAKVSITRWRGTFKNYYSADGAAYVDVTKGLIRTAFKQDEYTDGVKKMMEEVSKYEQSRR